ARASSLRLVAHCCRRAASRAAGTAPSNAKPKPPTRASAATPPTIQALTASPPGASTPVELADLEVPICHRPVVALEEGRPGAVGAVEAGAGAALAEEADVLAVLLLQLDAEVGRLRRVLGVEAVEGGLVGLAVADVDVLVDRLAVPGEGEPLALQGDVVALP